MAGSRHAGAITCGHLVKTPRRCRGLIHRARPLSLTPPRWEMLRTHSETSSNYLCTNGESGNWSVEKGPQAIKTHAPNAKVEDNS